MQTIRMMVHGIPKAQPRVKAFSRGNHAGVYDPGTANDWKCLVAEQALRVKPPKPFIGPLLVDIQFHLPRPKRLMRKNDPTGPIPHTVRPDVDNLIKAVLDALKGLLWADDKQVWGIRAKKYYHAIDEGPHAAIMVQFGAEE